MGMNFLGKLNSGAAKTVYYLDGNGVVVQATSTVAGSIVQAFKRLVLSEANMSKGLRFDQLHTLLSAYNSSLEILTSTPDEDFVRRLEPLGDRNRGILEASLKKVAGQLSREEDEYHDWRGVRDLDVAHENLKNRQEEIFDLNQKLVHNALEPQFIYNPTGTLRRTVSAWQTTDRVRFHELKYQSKERATAIRQRIEFTRRISIKELKDKRKEILAELDEERKRERDHEKTVAAVVEEGVGATVLVTVRSRAIEVRGRRDPAVRQCADDVQESARRLRRILKERLGMEFVEPPKGQGLSLLTPSAKAFPLPQALASSQSVGEDLHKVVGGILESRPAPAKLPEIRFPTPEGTSDRRFAYLGLALRDDFSKIPHPILYDLDEQGPRHTAVVGGSGSGKSVAAGLIVEGAALHDVPVLIFDPTGSWTGFGEPCASKSLLDAYPEFGMRRDWARSFNLKVVSPGDLQAVPAILSETLDSPGITVLTSEALTTAQEAEFASALLTELQLLMKSWPESKRLRLLAVFEEAHRYFAEKRLEPILEVFSRTARSKGVGLLIVSQVAVDLPPAIRNNVATKIQLFTNYAGDLTRAAQVFGTDYRKLIPKFPKGVGAVLYPEFGSALCAFRPPLHSTFGIPVSSHQFFRSIHELAKLASDLTRHAATSDTTATKDVASGENAVRPAQEGETTGHDGSVATHDATDWRDVATSATHENLTAAGLAAAIRETGLTMPSLRTLQRFLRSARGGSA